MRWSLIYFLRIRIARTPPRAPWIRRKALSPLKVSLKTRLGSAPHQSKRNGASKKESRFQRKIIWNIGRMPEDEMKESP